MKIPCTYDRCGERRIHHERPDVERGTQMCEVPEDHVGVSYCSITCACLDGSYHVRYGWLIDPKTKRRYSKARIAMRKLHMHTTRKWFGSIRWYFISRKYKNRPVVRRTSLH